MQIKWPKIKLYNLILSILISTANIHNLSSQVMKKFVFLHFYHKVVRIMNGSVFYGILLPPLSPVGRKKFLSNRSCELLHNTQRTSHRLSLNAKRQKRLSLPAGN